MGVCLIDRQFARGAGWSLAMGALSFFGVIHAWNPNNVLNEFTLGWAVGWRYAVPYGLIAIVLLALAPRARQAIATEDVSSDQAPTMK